MEQDNLCFRFSKNENSFFRIFWIDITDLTVLIGQLVFMTFIHFLDIGSDIYVLLDIYNHEDLSYFFFPSLSILILSFISSSIPKSYISILDSILDFFLGLTQIKFLINVYDSYISGEVSEKLVKARIDESLLESAPQSLLQLYILLQYYSRISDLDLSIYYISIALSLISIAYSMVSYEIHTFNNFYI